MSRGGRGGFGSQFTFNPELLGVSVHASARHRNPDAFVEGLAQPLPAYPTRQHPVLPLVRDPDSDYELASLKSLRLHFKLSKFHLTKSPKRIRPKTSMVPNVERYSEQIVRKAEKEDEKQRVGEEDLLHWHLLPEELRPKKSVAKAKKRKQTESKKSVDVEAKLRLLEANEGTTKENAKQTASDEDEDEDSEEETNKDNEDEKKDGEEEEEDEEMDEGTDYANNYFDNGEGYGDDDDDNLDEGDTY